MNKTDILIFVIIVGAAFGPDIVNEHIGGFRVEQSSFGGYGRSLVSRHLLLQSTPRVIGEKRPNEGEDYQRPTGPEFWRKSFLPNILRLLLGFTMFLGGLRLSAIDGRRYNRLWVTLGAVLGFLGFVLLVGPIPWR